MKREKPKGLTFEKIINESGVSARTVKRYFAGFNVTLSNSDAIKKAILNLTTISKKGSSKNEGETYVSISSLKIRENVFWSNPNGKLPLKNIIAAVVVGRNISDLIALKKRFGDKVVRDLYMKISDNKKNHLANRILNVS